MNDLLEILLTLIGLCILGAILGGVVLGLVALGRIKSLARRVRMLEEAGGASRERPAAHAVPAGQPSRRVSATTTPWSTPKPGSEVDGEPSPETVGEPASEADRAPTSRARPADPGPGGAPRSGGGEPDSEPSPLSPAKPTAATAAGRAPRPGVQWERLLGIRGAAILGGVALVIAALLFFQYAIQEGWFDERMRVGTGALVGSLCLLAHGRLRATGYRVVADVLAGSGAAVHYAAAWAGFHLYGLFPHTIGFAWMVLTTVVCCALALRARSQLIAVFGLVGGFATPLLLSAVPSGAVSLFGYILLLDLALLGIGRRRDWPWLGLLGLAGTTGIQLLWLLEGHTEEAAAGLLACGVFGLLFAAFGGEDASPYRQRWRAARVGGILLPFALALHYANHVELGDDYLLIAAVAALLGAAGTFLGRRLDLVALPSAAAAGAAALSATWLLAADGASASLAEFGLGTGATAVVLVALGAWPRRERGADSQAPATYSLLVLFALTWTVLAGGGRSEAPHTIWLVVWIHLALVVRSRAALPALPALAGLAAGLALAAANDGVLLGTTDAPSFAASCAPYAAPTTAAVLLALALAWRAHPTPRALALSALGCAFWTPFLHSFPPPGTSSVAHFAPIVAALIVAACAAARCAHVAATAAVVLLSAGSLVGHLTVARFAALDWSFGETAPWLLAGIVATTLAPVCFRASLQRTRVVGLVAAASALIGLEHVPVERWIALWSFAHGDEGVGLAPLILAAPPLGAFLLLRGERPAGEVLDGTRRARTAYAAVAWLLCAMALPLELDAHQERGFIGLWPWIALAPAAAGWAWLATRRASPVCSLAALAAAVGSTVPWCVLALFPDAFMRQEGWFANGFSYAYGLAFGCALVVLRFTADPVAPMPAGGPPASVHDDPAARPAGDVPHPYNPPGRLRSAYEDLEARLIGGRGAWAPRSLLRGLVGGLACLVPFAWVSLSVINAYGETPRLNLGAIDLNGNLALSLAWALYSFTLLAIGTRRRTAALRWASLGFLLATIGKVFLFDLANLDGLQRVGSFFGLALCLILVSLFYQRFVFTRRAAS